MTAVSISCGVIRDMNGRSYFPRLINLSINDFSSAISYWFTVAKMSRKFYSAASTPVMSHTMAARKLRCIHSKNFYKELDNFSTAFMDNAPINVNPVEGGGGGGGGKGGGFDKF